MTKKPLIPLDLSGLGAAPFAEIEPLLEALHGEQDPKADRRVRAVLLDRALRLLRQGSQTEIGDEALGRPSGLRHGAGPDSPGPTRVQHQEYWRMCCRKAALTRTR